MKNERVQPQDEDEFDGWDFVEEGEEVRNSYVIPTGIKCIDSDYLYVLVYMEYRVPVGDVVDLKSRGCRKLKKVHTPGSS